MASQYSLDDITAGYGSDWKDETPSNSRSNVPSVVISAAELPLSPSSGRVPSKLPPGHSNFSRPAPPPIDRSEERKRQVLMRNAHSHSPEPRANAQRPPLYQTRSTPAPSPPPTASLPPPPTNQRVVSQTSVYSNYSYYQYEGGPPSSAHGSATHLSPMPTRRLRYIHQALLAPLRPVKMPRSLQTR